MDHQYFVCWRVPIRRRWGPRHCHVELTRLHDVRGPAGTDPFAESVDAAREVVAVGEAVDGPRVLDERLYLLAVEGVGAVVGARDE